MGKASEAKYTLIEGRYTLNDVDYVKHLDTVGDDSLMGGFYIGIVVGLIAALLLANVLESLVKLVRRPHTVRILPNCGRTMPLAQKL